MSEQPQTASQLREQILEAMSWCEDLQRGRWGITTATELLERYEALLLAVPVSPGRPAPPDRWHRDIGMNLRCNECKRLVLACICQAASNGPDQAPDLCDLCNVGDHLACDMALRREVGTCGCASSRHDAAVPEADSADKEPHP